MELKKFYNKKVRIVTDIGNVFGGSIGDYFYPEDNENGKESIVMDVEKGEYPLVEFYEKDIKTIEILS